MNGTICIGKRASKAAMGSEMAPQIKTCGANAARQTACAAGKVPDSGSSRRAWTCPSTTSTSNRRRATSNTGEIRPCQIVNPTFITSL